MFNKGTAALTSCTVSGNTGTGGGLYNYGSGYRTSAVTLTDTIVAGNIDAASNPDDIGGNSPGEVTGTYNLIGTGGSGAIQDGIQGNIVLSSLAGLGLAPLGNYGGPTATMALYVGSQAIGVGTEVPGITTDQRGYPLNTPVPDIGAFQSQPDQPIYPPVFTVYSTADDGSVGTLPLGGGAGRPVRGTQHDRHPTGRGARDDHAHARAARAEQPRGIDHHLRRPG